MDGVASNEGESHIKAVQSQNGKPKAAVHLFEYEEGPWPCSVSILPHLHDVAESLADYIARISEESIKHRGSFTIVLSGGSLVKVSLPCVHNTKFGMFLSFCTVLMNVFGLDAQIRCCFYVLGIYFHM